VKTLVLGVTGSIAAFKAASITSLFKKAGYDVHVIMTQNAQKFVAPLTFEVLSGNRAVTDMWDRDVPYEVEHISLAKKADVF
jgi:phosphopantothenoylcysteine decarboxylase/phosphopantothenate--cysteine ligase